MSVKIVQDYADCYDFSFNKSRSKVNFKCGRCGERFDSATTKIVDFEGQKWLGTFCPGCDKMNIFLNAQGSGIYYL